MKNIYFVGAPTLAKGIEDFNYIAESLSEVNFYWFTYRLADSLVTKYPHIKFIVGLEDDSLKKMIKDKMNIFISCSHYEGFCLPIAEAMLLEKPVISYALDEVASEFGEYIQYVERFNILQFNEKVKKLLKSETSKNNLIKAKIFIENNYTPEIVSNKLINIITK